MRILVTGAAGFIGFHLAKRLCARGDEVIGIDNLNDYYDVSLKTARLRELEPYIHDASRTCRVSRLPAEDSVAGVTSHGSFTFIKLDIADREAMEKLFRDHEFDRVVHLAAQAGVRYSLVNPHAYVNSNLIGFVNVLEGCRSVPTPLRGEGQGGGGCLGFHLVYASSSSVYGLNTKLPFSTSDNVDHPISLYAATKKSNELMAHAYSHLYGIPTTGLRFFTVYGPWGRPDMAYFKFTKAILEGNPIDVYNDGCMRRDFTYIDDIVEGVVRVMDRIPGMDQSPVASHGSRLYRLYNIGNNNPVELMDFIRAIECATGKKAKMNMLPMQPGDVTATYADVDDLMRDVGFAPKTPIEQGIQGFVDWYRSYYNL